MVRAVLLMPEEKAALARDFARSSGIALISTTVDSLEKLKSAFSEPCDLLMSFNTGVIVPEHILQLPGLIALNIHAASPDFPGRDPHHFALYHGVKKYGATIHYMTGKVDQGHIINMKLFDVPERISAAELLAKADKVGIELMRQFFNAYAVSGAPEPKSGIFWGSQKSTRNDFIELCRIDCTMPESEFLRRLESTAMPGFNNLYIDIHGYRFRLQGKVK